MPDPICRDFKSCVSAGSVSASSASLITLSPLVSLNTLSLHVFQVVAAGGGQRRPDNV